MRIGIVFSLLAAGMLLASTPTSVCGQDSDTIQLNEGKLLRGRVIGTDTTSVTIKTRDDSPSIRIDSIKSLNLGGQPSQLSRAKNNLENGRYDDCLKEIEKIDGDAATALIKTEIEYCRVAATAYNALGHGSTTIREAVTGVSNFITSNENSHHYYEVTELYARLALESGEFAKAETAFARMSQVDIEKIKADGLIGLGRAQLAQNKLQEAARSFAAVATIDSNDSAIMTAKMIARCLAARVLAAGDNSEEAIKQLEEIIKREDADNSTLFAAAYNSLGYSYLQAGEKKKALHAFLHTNLLYHTQSEMDAEALYHLASIWTDQNETDHASRARQSLKSKYRNSYWSSLSSKL